MEPQNSTTQKFSRTGEASNDEIQLGQLIDSFMMAPLKHVGLEAGFHKVNGRWLITHEHKSVPADMRTGRAMMNLPPDGTFTHRLIDGSKNEKSFLCCDIWAWSFFCPGT